MWPPGRFVHSNCYSGRLGECKHGDEKRTALKVRFFFLPRRQSGIYSFERHFTYEQLQIVSRDLRVYCPEWRLCKLSYGFRSKWIFIVKDRMKRKLVRQIVSQDYCSEALTISYSHHIKENRHREKFLVATLKSVRFLPPLDLWSVVAAIVQSPKLHSISCGFSFCLLVYLSGRRSLISKTTSGGDWGCTIWKLWEKCKIN